MQSIVRLSNEVTYSDATDCVAIISDEPWESEDDIELLRQQILIKIRYGMVIDLAELGQRVQCHKPLRDMLISLGIITVMRRM